MKSVEGPSEVKDKIDTADIAREAIEKGTAELKSMLANVSPVDASVLKNIWLSVAQQNPV